MNALDPKILELGQENGDFIQEVCLLLVTICMRRFYKGGKYCTFEDIIIIIIIDIIVIMRVIKSRRMRWAGHVARTEEGRGVHKVLVGKP